MRTTALRRSKARREAEHAKETLLRELGGMSYGFKIRSSKVVGTLKVPVSWTIY